MDKYVIRKRKSSEITDRFDEKCQKLIETDDQSRFLSKSISKENEASKLEESQKVNQQAVSTSTCSSLQWKKLQGENLNCDYCLLYSRKEADELLRQCEQTLTYNEGQLARVKVFGQWHDIPRKQVAHGEPGLAYNFSKNTVPARPWIPLLEKIKDRITDATGYTFNFVLINRYKDGCDHMGEHRDDEKDLVHGYPIASLSLGQARDFVFKHGDARGKNAKRSIAPVTVELQHGCLLMMKHPTNTYWYHSLPQRKRLSNVRINMTFRKFVVK